MTASNYTHDMMAVVECCFVSHDARYSRPDSWWSMKHLLADKDSSILLAVTDNTVHE